jgi:hypothetical protein
LLCVESLKQRGQFAAFQEVAEFGRWTAGWFRKAHAREADLMQLVEVKDLFQLGRGSIQGGEDQGSGIVLVITVAGDVELIGAQAFARDIERCVHRLPHGEVGSRNERQELSFALLQDRASLPRGDVRWNTEQMRQNGDLPGASVL